MRARDMSKGQLAMVEDGFPRELILTQEERLAAWEKKPPQPVRLDDKRSEPEPDTVRLMAEIDDEKRTRAASRREKRAALAAAEPVDLSKMRWEPRRNRFVSDELSSRPRSESEKKFDWVQPERRDTAMMSLTTNTRGETQMGQSFKDMSGPDLVAAYNRMADKPIKRFASAAEGVRRCMALAAKKLAPKVKAKGNGAAKPGAKVEKTGIAAEFGFRDGSSREKLLLSLWESNGKQVPLTTLAKAVIGTSSSTDELLSVSKGLPWRIKESRLPYEFRKETVDGKVTLGLHAKK